MATPLNAVLILGNGFDLEMGQKTSFESFYISNHCPYYYPAPLILHLNQAWEDNLQKVRWFDFENELLNYYNLRLKTTDYPDVINDKELKCLKNNTIDQLHYGTVSSEDVQAFKAMVDKGIIRQKGPLYYVFRDDLLMSPLVRDRKALDIIKTNFCKYLSDNILQEPNRNCLAFHVFYALVNNIKPEDTINVYSFNYTNIPWGFSSEYKSIVHYVHGNYEEGKIILGTGDENLNKEYDFLQKSFDKHFSPPPIVDDLAAAEEVIIFGHSLGINDRQYFKPFFTERSRFDQTKRKKITIITKDDSSVVEIKRALQQLTDNQLSVLMSKNDVTFIKTEMEPEDQEELKEFFHTHRIRGTKPEEIIGKIVEHKKMLKDS